MTTLVPPTQSYLLLLTIFAMSFILPVGAGMKPRFVDGMKNITVEMGQDATFVCVVSEIHVSGNINFTVCYKLAMLLPGIQSGLGTGQQ